MSSINPSLGQVNTHATEAAQAAAPADTSPRTSSAVRVQRAASNSIHISPTGKITVPTQPMRAANAAQPSAVADLAKGVGGQVKAASEQHAWQRATPSSNIRGSNSSRASSTTGSTRSASSSRSSTEIKDSSSETAASAASEIRQPVARTRERAGAIDYGGSQDSASIFTKTTSSAASSSSASSSPVTSRLRSDALRSSSGSNPSSPAGSASSSAAAAAATLPKESIESLVAKPIKTSFLGQLKSKVGSGRKASDASEPERKRAASSSETVSKEKVFTTSDKLLKALESHITDKTVLKRWNETIEGVKNPKNDEAFVQSLENLSTRIESMLRGAKGPTSELKACLKEVSTVSQELNKAKSRAEVKEMQGRLDEIGQLKSQLATLAKNSLEQKICMAKLNKSHIDFDQAIDGTKHLSSDQKAQLKKDFSAIFPPHIDTGDSQHAFYLSFANCQAKKDVFAAFLKEQGLHVTVFDKATFDQVIALRSQLQAQDKKVLEQFLFDRGAGKVDVDIDKLQEILSTTSNVMDPNYNAKLKAALTEYGLSLNHLDNNAFTTFLLDLRTTITHSSSSKLDKHSNEMADEYSRLHTKHQEMGEQKSRVADDFKVVAQEIESTAQFKMQLRKAGLTALYNKCLQIDFAAASDYRTTDRSGREITGKVLSKEDGMNVAVFLKALSRPEAKLFVEQYAVSIEQLREKVSDNKIILPELEGI